MLIIGHPLIPFEPLVRVTKIEDIKKIKSNSIILVDFIDKDLIQYSMINHLAIALHVDSIKDACLANALGAKFIVVEKDLSKKIQILATEYLFDAKVILQIKNEEEIEIAAENFIDGVVFKKGII